MDLDNSIDSVELNRQIDMKLQNFEKKEKVQFLQFKEQTMVKRLIDLREDHKQILIYLEQQTHSLINTVKDLMADLTKQSYELLEQEEQSIRNYLQMIQNNKSTPDNVPEGLTQKITFESIKVKVHSIMQKLQDRNSQTSSKKEFKMTYAPNFPLRSEISQSNQKIEYPQSSSKKLQYSGIKQSTKQIRESPSPLKELNNFMRESKTNKLEDLETFISRLKSRVGLTMKMSGTMRISPGKTSPRRTSPLMALTKQSYEYIKFRR